MSQGQDYSAFHKEMDLYLRAEPSNTRNLKRINFSQGSNAFYFDLCARTLNLHARKRNLEGIGDLSGLSLNLLDDTNAGHVSAAAQQMVQVRSPKDYYGLTERNLEEAVDPQTWEEILSPQRIIMQGIREGAALKLMEDYLKFPQIMTMEKETRCAFWRYLMYSGFVQVDGEQKGPLIIEESIPELPLLTKLANRFEIKNGIKNYDPDSAKRIAKNFLEFNGIKTL